MSTFKSWLGEEFCGCCGRPARVGLDWCMDCLPHIKHGLDVKIWDRTFYAQTESACPYSIEWK